MNQAELTSYLQDFANLPRTTQLVREKGIRAFLLHLRALEEMPRHQVNGPITVQCLQGSVLFTTEDETMNLRAGSIISVPGGVPHSLTAKLASLMLVTMSEGEGAA